MTDLFLKCVWAFAVVALVLALVILGGGSGSRTAGGVPVVYPQASYFTKPDPARSVIEYGVNEGGRMVIYNTLVAK